MLDNRFSIIYHLSDDTTMRDFARFNEFKWTITHASDYQRQHNKIAHRNHTPYILWFTIKRGT